MGKNFSGNNLGQRKASDFYETPYSMTRQLLERETFPLPVLEPACGGGAISRVLSEHGMGHLAYDRERDFLREESRYPALITNPPFSLAYEFICKAKEVCEQKFALLLPLSYLHGKQRHDAIWTDAVFPFKCVYVFTRYPMLGDPLREDGCYRTGMMVYGWFVWERGWPGEPVIRWIDNHRCVLGAR